VDFIYDYPFDENNYMESEKIFRNSISNIRE